MPSNGYQRGLSANRDAQLSRRSAGSSPVAPVSISRTGRLDRWLAPQYAPSLRRSVLAVTVVATALLAATSGPEATPAVPSGGAAANHAAAPVTITVRLGARGHGTFRITGGPTDSGRVVVKRKVSHGRLRMTQRMTGRYGTLVI